MKKVLIFGMFPVVNGVGTFIANIVSSTYSQIHYDFLFQGENEKMFKEDDFINLGCKVFKIPHLSLKHFIKIKKIEKTVYDLIKKNKYDVVWINESMPIENTILDAAYKAKVNKIIYHSHNSANFITGWRRLPFLLLFKITKIGINKKATDFWACSNLAADWMFYKKNVNSKTYKFIPNGIDLKKFTFDSKKRNEVRKRLSLMGNQIVIGNISRVSYQKNPLFALRIFYEFHKKYPNSKYIVAGNGPLMSSLKKRVKHYKLDNEVIILGSISNANASSLINGFDAFLFPTRFEGLSISLLEAQTNGLYCVCSNAISRETNISNHLLLVKSKGNKNRWLEDLAFAVNNRLLDFVPKTKTFNLDNSAYLVKKYIDE